MPDPKAEYWDVSEVAEYWNCKPASVIRRRTRKAMPAEDKMFGRSPAWRPATIINFTGVGQGTRTDLKD